MSLKLWCTTHALDRYRERIDPRATERDVEWAVIAGRGIEPDVAMAMMHRKRRRHEQGDRFVITACGRGILVINLHGAITTVTLLSSVISPVIDHGEGSDSTELAQAPLDDAPVIDDETWADVGEIVSRLETLTSKLEVALHRSTAKGVVEQLVSKLKREQKAFSHEHMLGWKRKLEAQRGRYEKAANEADAALRWLVEHHADSRYVLDGLAEIAPWLKRTSSWPGRS